jgi:hypothetical protein
MNCRLNQDGTWDFQVRGRDIAGNTGGWSTETVTVDSTPPNLTVYLPDSEWTNEFVIPLKWESDDDELSGYEVYYYFTSYQGPEPGDSDWLHWLDRGPGLIEVNFTTNDPLGLTLFENNTYYINITAVDDAGNRFHKVVNVTIDITPPKVTLEVRDQFRNLIEPGLISQTEGISLINITSRASDPVSGISSNKIEYIVTLESPASLSCGPGPDPHYSACSTADDTDPAPNEIDGFDETKSIQYSAVATDRAGNYYRTPLHFSVTHPLANFGERNVFLELGSTKLVPVAVRNIQDETDNVTLNLTGTDTFSKFYFDCQANSCSMDPDGRSMTVLNLNPFSERIYYVRLISSQPDDYYLELSSRSSADLSVTDYHVLNITTSYPVYFPGMEPWAMLLLLVLAGFSFGLVSNRTGS